MNDSESLENLLRSAGVPGGPAVAMSTAMELPDLIADLHEHLDTYQGDPLDASGEGFGLTVWTEASSEARSALLLSLAWGARDGDLPPVGAVTADVEWKTGHAYAVELHKYACAATDSETFHGKGYPAMPLPGQAGALASSCGFDLDDLGITFATVLILLSVVRKAAV